MACNDSSNTVQLYKLFEKCSVDFVTKKRTAPVVPSFFTRLIYGEDEYAAPDEKDLQNWRQIAQYMQAARPVELNDAAVLSGPVSSAELTRRVAARKNHDVFIEDLRGDRAFIAQMLSQMPRTQLQQFESAYFPHANAVVNNSRSPGVLLHELGHAVDLSKRKNESNLRRWLRWQIKPLLWQELSAWKKGRKAYQAGLAASPEANSRMAREQYAKNMQSYNKRKYPAFGTYFGGAAGGLAGALASAMLTAQGGGAGEEVRLAAMLGGVGGTILGIPSGAIAGKLWSKLRENANKRKAEKQLLAAMKNPELAVIRQRLLQLRADEEKAKKKTKNS